MSDRSGQPGYNSYIDDWHTPLNRNFSEIGEDVDQLLTGKEPIHNVAGMGLSGMGVRTILLPSLMRSMLRHGGR